MFCMYCGTKVPDEARFCMKCGKPIPVLAEAEKPVADNEYYDEEEEPIVEEVLEEEPVIGFDDEIVEGEEIYPQFVYQSACAPKQEMTSSYEEDNFIVPTDRRVNQTVEVNVDELINSSINFMNTSTNGYYCIYCSDFVNYNDVRRNGRGACPSCGNHAVGTKADIMVEGWGVRLVNNLLYGAQDPYREIKEYYRSEYFKSTGYKFEAVVTDKGLCGEYMLDLELNKVRVNRPGKPFHVFYNVIVPEPNGSFQEIDAVVFYGGFIFSFEVKNRSGRYQYQHFTDKEWTLISSSGTTTVHNPLLQNDEHINALMYYYNQSSKKKNLGCFQKITRQSMISMVSLGVRGDFNASIDGDEYDSVVLSRLFNFFCGGSTYQNIAQFFDMCDQADGGFNDEHAIANMEVIEEILYQSQQEKDLYKRNRMADTRDKGKFDYRYFYMCMKRNYLVAGGAINTVDEGWLIRTNGVYTQCISDDSYEWRFDDGIRLENGQLVTDYSQDYYVVDLKNLPLEIVKARDCVARKVPYSMNR